MSARPLVSAVIPTRHRPELVCRAVRTALSQTYPNMEVVVVVDGPDAPTCAALAALNDARVRIVALDENVGGSEARNRGVREAGGKYIALLDDDDEWLPEKIERQFHAFAELQSPFAVVTCKHVLKHPGKPDRILPLRVPGRNEDISEYMFYERFFRRPAYGPQTSTYFATKELFTSIPFKKGLRCHQDWQWFLTVMSERGAQHVLLEEPLCLVHEHAGAPSVTRATQWKESLEWLESSARLFSPRAYSSFLVRQCLYRCTETTNRLGLFFSLLKRSRARGYLDLPMVLIAVRWYFYSPSVRYRVMQKRLTPQLR